MKWSTRFDAPFACLDVFDEERKLVSNGTFLYLKAMCRKNDKTLLKYELNLELFGQVVDEPDDYETYF